MRAFSIYCVIPIMCAVFLSMQAAATCSKPMLIAYSDWSRASGNTVPQQAEYGLDFEILQGILEVAGCSFDHRPIPFKRIQEAIRHGLVDGTMGASLTVPRQDYAWFTEPYRQEIMAMFMLADEVTKFNPSRMSDLALSEYRIGLGIGSWHGAKLEHLISTKPSFRQRILYTDDFDIMYQWLQRGRVNIAINDIHYGYFILKRANLLDAIKPHSFYINTNDVHIMLSKKSVSNHDATVISEAVGRFRNTPTYNAILAKYSTDN